MDKQTLRAILKEKRSTLAPDEKKRKDAAVVERIAKSTLFQRASMLLIYAPLPGEINLLPLVRLSRQMGKPVAFPRCDTETNTMQFYLLKPDARLTEGAYRIPEPPADAPICVPDKAALCILPALTFDPTGARLGYGKGYYDRFLETYPGITVGAVYEAMMVKSVPTEPHDKAVSFVFTERRVLDCRTEEKDEKTTHVPAKKHDGGLWEQICQRVRATAKELRARIGGGTGERSLAPTDEEETKTPHSAQATGVRALHMPPILVASVLCLLLLSRLIDTHLTDRNNEYAVVVLLQVLIFLIPAVIYGKLRGEAFPTRIRLRLPRPDHLWFSVCMLAVMITGGMLCEILTGGIASLSGNFTLYDTFVARLNGNVAETVYVILAYAVLPAFCEELIFRSILCAEYERYGVGVAIAASALFFACLHFSFPLLLTYLLLGALLAAAMYTTRSFLTAVILHLCYNLFCLFGQPYLSAFYVNAGSNEIFIFCLVVIFLLFGAFAVGEARKIYHRYANRNLDSSYTRPIPMRQLPRTFFFAMLSPATGVCLAIWLIMAVINLL